MISVGIVPGFHTRAPVVLLTLSAWAPQVEVMFGVQSWRFQLQVRSNDRRQGARERHRTGRGPDRQPSARDPRAVPGRLVRYRSRLLERDLGQRRADLVLTAAAARRRDPASARRRLIFRDPLSAGGTKTEAEDAPPSLTTRERDVLLALCRPLLDRDMFTEPASTRSIADELVITQAAVKQHLANLYDKFGVPAERLQPPRAGWPTRRSDAAPSRSASCAKPRAHRSPIRPRLSS